MTTQRNQPPQPPQPPIEPDRSFLYGRDLPSWSRFTDRDGCFVWSLVALATVVALFAIGVWAAFLASS
jgi:hypothetical protein